MTPEEIEANSTAIMRMLSSFGATPEAAATWGAISGIERALERERGRQQPSPDQRAPPPSQPAWADVANMLGAALPPGRQPPGRQGAPLDAPPPRRPPEPLTLNAPGIGYNVPPPTNALMPQTPEEAARYERSGAAADLYTSLPMMMAPMGPAVNAAVRGVGSMLRAAPRTSAAGLAGLSAFGAPGETQDQTPVPPTVAAARKLVTDQQTIVTGLQEELARFAPSVGNRRQGESDQQYRARIIELQRELGRATDDQNQPLYRRRAPDRQGRFQPGELDGSWEGRTTEAAALLRQRIQAQLTAAEAERDKLRTAADTLGTETANANRQANRDEAERNLSGPDRFVRDNAGWLGPVAGFAGGSLLAWPLRAGVAGATNYFHRGRVAAANNLLPPLRADGQVQHMTQANAPGRFANVNRFYTEGGGREPFRLSETGRGGWTENRVRGERFAPADNLYPQGHWSRQYVRGQDIPPMGVLGASNYYTAGRIETAEREVREARVASDKNGSRENMQRLVQAEARLAWARTYERATQTAPMSYVPAMIGRQYDMSRPLVERAQGEVGRLSRWRRSQ